MGTPNIKPKIFSCTNSRVLAKKITKSFGTELGNIIISKYSDGEFQPSYEESIRGTRIFIIGSTNPSSENLMELLLMVDAAKRASARHIAAVIPYFGWARQDRKDKPRVPIAAKMIAGMIESAGATRVMTMDLHADQIQGFFDIPVDNVYASPLLLGDVWRQKYKDLIVVSPDVGGVVRARALAKRLDDADLAIIDKRRPMANVAEVMHIIGDVSGKTCIMIDDLVDTAGTLCSAAAALKKQGAVKVVAYCTHPVLSGAAIENLRHSVLNELIVTDTIPLSDEAVKLGKIRQLSVADMLAETIRRIAAGESVSSLYVD